MTQGNSQEEASAGAHRVRPGLQVVAALVRWRESLLLVQERIDHQDALGWSLPGGGVEPGELFPEALERELLEETGLRMHPVTSLAFVLNTDSPGYPSALLCAFDCRARTADIAVNDPSNKIVDARFFPLDAAIELMMTTTAPLYWRPAVAYLRGKAPPGTFWSYRRREDGTEQLHPL